MTLDVNTAIRIDGLNLTIVAFDAVNNFKSALFVTFSYKNRKSLFTLQIYVLNWSEEMFNLAKTLFLVLLLLAPCLAQTQTISLTGGTVARNGYFINGADPLRFKFKFLGSNTEINGGLYDLGGGLNQTDVLINCCFYGKRFVLSDWAEGQNNFRQTTEPIIVNGTTYNTIYFRGEIRFTGGTTVPFYLKKKRIQTLKFPVTTRGFIRGATTLADRDSNPLFTAPLNMIGMATITIRPNDRNGANGFEILTIKYDLETPTN